MEMPSLKTTISEAFILIHSAHLFQTCYPYALHPYCCFKTKRVSMKGSDILSNGD